MALDISLATCAGHQLSGRDRSQKQRTVNPLIVPARYNFLYLPQAGPAVTGGPAFPSHRVVSNPAAGRIRCSSAARQVAPRTLRQTSSTAPGPPTSVSEDRTSHVPTANSGEQQS